MNSLGNIAITLGYRDGDASRARGVRQRGGLASGAELPGAAALRALLADL